eukprot:745200_1
MMLYLLSICTTVVVVISNNKDNKQNPEELTNSLPHRRRILSYSGHYDPSHYPIYGHTGGNYGHGGSNHGNYGYGHEGSNHENYGNYDYGDYGRDWNPEPGGNHGQGGNYNSGERPNSHFRVDGDVTPLTGEVNHIIVDEARGIAGYTANKGGGGGGRGSGGSSKGG